MKTINSCSNAAQIDWRNMNEDQSRNENDRHLNGSDIYICLDIKLNKMKERSNFKFSLSNLSFFQLCLPEQRMYLSWNAFKWYSEQ